MAGLPQIAKGGVDAQAQQPGYAYGVQIVEVIGQAMYPAVEPGGCVGFRT
jgi:hypothetical protein